MSDTRVSKHGFAWGWYGGAGITSANYLLTPQDTTPDVTNGCFFVTNNTSAVTYTYFDLSGYNATDRNGKYIMIHFRDANTTVQNSGQIWLTDTQGALPANSTLELVYYNSAWVEVGRSSVDQTPQAPQGAVRSVSYTFSGTIGGALLKVNTAQRIYVTASAVANITGFAGGVSDQALDLVVIGIGTNVFLTQSAGVLQIPGTGTFLLSGSATYRFLTYNGVEWYTQASPF